MQDPNGSAIGPIRLTATTAMYYHLIEISDEFRANRLELEHMTRRRTASGNTAWQTITIPVVVHVLYHTNEQNISDSQVISQIEALNRDFSAANTDLDQVPEVWQGLITDSGIRFALATKDPDGTPSSGINRIKTDWKSFPIEMFSDNPEPVKSSAAGGADAWPSDKCLNIWVCGLQGLVMGYAQFPGGPPETDGVVMSNWCFGTVGTVKPPFHLGRSTVHEIAHWLNLHDIWGYGLDCTGGDRVDDTPIQAEANFGKPAYPHISCDNGPHGDMYMNYMDQVDDDSMFFFTRGQVERMRGCLDAGRKSFVHP